MARGGKREGAGRKPLPQEQKKVNITIKVKPEIAVKLRERVKNEGQSIGDIIESLL